jgi:hypothetical protein
MPRATTRAERIKEMHRAERTLEAKLTQLKRLTTSISLWQRRVKYYSAQAARTDEEIIAEREASAARRQQRHAGRFRRIRL